MVQGEQDQRANLPWVEKYRPEKLDELISHKDIVTTIRKFIDENRLPHLLLYGPPGTGKTSTILACARQMYTKKEFGALVLELNASDERGIGVVRERILTFCSTGSIYASGSGVKLVILDEVDAMTRDAQNALRRIIEKYTDNVRFCLIGNYLSKVIPALQSRSTRFRFAPLRPEQMLDRLRVVVEAEKVNITEDGERALVTLAQGDMRRVLNVLQSTGMAFDVVNEEAVYTCVGHPTKRDVNKIVDCLLNMDFPSAKKSIEEIKILKGLALHDILTEVHGYVHRLEIPVEAQVVLLEKMAELEHRLAAGSSEKMQLGALVAAFHIARQLVCLEGDAQAAEPEPAE